MALRRFFILLALAIFLALAVAIWLYPSNADFRTENPFWNGLARFTTKSQAIPLDSLSSLPAESKDTALLLIPYLPLTEDDRERFKNYVFSGGTLVLIDDYGYGNGLLEYLGLKIRFSGEPLLDPLFNYRNKWFPQITDFADVPATSGVNSLLLNHASTLEGVPEARVTALSLDFPPGSIFLDKNGNSVWEKEESESRFITFSSYFIFLDENGDSVWNKSEPRFIAGSSYFSFLDENGNSVWDEDAGEPQGIALVAAQLSLGEGWLFLIADPSILINTMEERADNRLFIQNIVSISSKQILLDQSHLPRQAMDTAKEALRTVRRSLATPLGTLGIIAIIVALTLTTLRHRKGERP